MTTVECVSAAGTALPPLVVFKAQGSFNTRWLPDDHDRFKGWRWATSNTGWSNDTLALDWLSRVFEPETCCLKASPSDRRLLILDGHGSHVKANFIAFCVEHAIDLLVLPAHSSALTQPLDVGIFRPLKGAMNDQSDAMARTDPGRVQKVDWVSRLADARTSALTERNIRSGWRSTGLHPFNPSRVVPPNSYALHALQIPRETCGVTACLTCERECGVHDRMAAIVANSYQGTSDLGDFGVGGSSRREYVVEGGKQAAQGSPG